MPPLRLHLPVHAYARPGTSLIPCTISSTIRYYICLRLPYGMPGIDLGYCTTRCLATSTSTPSRLSGSPLSSTWYQHSPPIARPIHQQRPIEADRPIDSVGAMQYPLLCSTSIPGNDTGTHTSHVCFLPIRSCRIGAQFVSWAGRGPARRRS